MWHALCSLPGSPGQLFLSLVIPSPPPWAGLTFNNGNHEPFSPFCFSEPWPSSRRVSPPVFLLFSFLSLGWLPRSLCFRAGWWGLCGSGLSCSCQGDLGRDSVKIEDEESEGTRDRGCGSAWHRPRAMSGATASRTQQSGDGQERDWAGLSE